MKPRFRHSSCVGHCARLLAAAITLLCCHLARAEPMFYPKAPTTKYADWFQVASHNTYYNKFQNREEDWINSLDHTKAIEFDVWPYDSWRVYHNVAGESYCNKSIRECLKSVRTWHDTHQGHDPITIFLEMKNAEGTEVAGFRVWDLNGILCGSTRGSQENGRGNNDAIFACSELFRPIDLIGKYPSLREAAQAGAWPSLESLRGRIIFVINSADHSVAQKYLQESRLTSTPQDDRGEANAFVMVGAGSAEDITGTPGTLSGKPALAKNVLFYNAECGKWNANLGRLIRVNNYLSRGYYCEAPNDNPGQFKNTWIGTNLLNFVAYNNIEGAYGLTTPIQIWNDGHPQGDFRGGRWQLTPDVQLRGQGGPYKWPVLVKLVWNTTLEKAMHTAESDPNIKYFIYIQKIGSCPSKIGWGPRVFHGTACFYSDTPQTLPAQGVSDLYVKRPAT